MKFRTQFDEKYTGAPGKIMDDFTQTVPDMNISLQQLLHNHSRGLPIMATFHQGEYFEELEIPQFDDLTDLYEARELLNEQEEALRARLKDELNPPEPEVPETPKEPLEVPLNEQESL